MRKELVLTLTFALAAVTVASAYCPSGYGSRGFSRYGGSGYGSYGRFLPATYRQHCTVLGVENNGSRLFVRDDADGREHWVRLNANVTVRGRKADFGRKKLSLTDLEPGQHIRVTTARRTGRIFTVKVLERTDPLDGQGQTLLAGWSTSATSP